MERPTYFKWLKRKVMKNHLVPNCYNELLAYLGSKVYRPGDKDINRYNDGVNLRVSFFEERPSNQSIDFMMEPCTYLEMFIALAYRLKHITESATNKHQMEYWFWTMLSNMDLLRFDDEHFDAEEIYAILTRFVNGSYRADGEGGPFHFPNFKQSPYSSYDISTIDLWSQAMWYINWTTDAVKL